MRLPRVTVCVAVAACLVLAFNVDLAEAKRKRKACKYNKRERIESECDPTTNSMKVTFNLKKGKAKCPPTKTLIKPCGDAAAADCKYRRDGKGSVCDPVTHTKLVSQKLKDGPETCPPTRLISKPCRKNMGKKRKNRKNNKIKGCRYDRSGAEWGPCEETTGVKRKEMPVVKGSKPDCPPTKTRTKPCGKSKKKWKKQRKGAAKSSGFAGTNKHAN